MGDFVYRISRAPSDRQLVTLLLAAMHDSAACLQEAKSAAARFPPLSDAHRVAACLAYVALQPPEVLREMLAEAALLERRRAVSGTIALSRANRASARQPRSRLKPNAPTSSNSCPLQ